MGNNGYSVTIVSPDATGHITPEAVSNACKEDTFLVSTVLVCSETGAISPLEDICKAVKAISKDILVHSDCVQGYGHLNIDVKRFGIDAITVSGHKIGGIKGAGFVYLKKGLRMTPLLHGGSQENARRAGTESLPAIAAFAAAVSQRRAVDPNLRPYAIERLTSIRGVRLIPSPDAPHIICVCMEGVPGEVAVRMLSDLQICVSTGSACKKGARSTALASMKLSGNVLDSIIRVSLSWENSENDINILSEALTNISKKFHIEKN